MPTSRSPIVRPLPVITLITLTARLARLAILTLAAFTVVGARTVGAQQGAPAPDVSRLAFMAGCWEQRTATRVTHEQWMAPLGGLMLGMSRTVVRDVAREWEALRVQLHEGAVTYIAQPGGRPPTYFAATSITESSVTFANPRHDFPQRILYSRVTPDSLVARIEGDQAGQVRGMDIPMRKIPCP